jgi:alginate O-acetyltransferase complex protein AlgI
MIFNSLQFILFFITISLTYYALPGKFRWFLLLVASCYFYMAFVPEYILILFLTILIDYIAGIFIEKASGTNRKLLLIISLISNIGILAIFKYYNFFSENITDVYHFFTGNTIKLQSLDEFLNWGTKVILPIGLSFHTFQAMSYTIEVYRGNQKAERHFGVYALYVMFYPQLVAGPIERPQNILPQLKANIKFDFENIKAGLLQMAWGFFKKVVFADRAGIMVDAAFNHQNLQSQNGFTLLVASVLYSFQIYCDFSGYSDIALGSAKVMGIDLMENFRTPYFSKSIAEFWRRWHISLSSWFKDYVYIPLGGSRVQMPRLYLNIMIIFLLSGFWHGNKWNFVVWGALHGLFLIFGQIKDKILGDNFGTQKYKYVHMIANFILVTFAWIFFRAESLHDAAVVIKKILTNTFHQPLQSALNNTELIFSFFIIAIICLKEKYFYKIKANSTISFVLLMCFFVVVCYIFGVFQAKQFIYFQF